MKNLEIKEMETREFLKILEEHVDEIFKSDQRFDFRKSLTKQDKKFWAIEQGLSLMKKQKSS